MKLLGIYAGVFCVCDAFRDARRLHPLAEQGRETLLAEGIRLTRFSLNISLFIRLGYADFFSGRPVDGRVKYRAGKYPVLPIDNGTIISEDAVDS